MTLGLRGRAMAIRKKGRAEFEFRGRDFVWYVGDERYLRVASEDKRFALAYRLDGDAVVKVTGPEFAGLPPSDARPVYLVPPEFEWSNVGALVNAILDWSFDESRPLQRAAPALCGW